MIVEKRENFIAKVDGPRTFPWRMAIVTTDDKDLAASSMTYLLSSPSRIGDLSWIKPGKVAWEWWSDWNLDGVDFVTGVNNDTYKAYIDFAAAHQLEYVILDEGWAVNLQADLMQVVKDINLKELVDYAAARNVGIILWAGYYAFDRDMENLCRYYAELGVKGFKVDFMDRDDQEMVAFNYRAAETCAKYKLLLDLHGMYKPSGLNRTYPNVLNFEGVNNDTYKAYIDFAAAHQLEYVILDEGWAVNLQADLMQVVKDINLKELVDYAAARNVGIILWAGYYAFDRDMENLCRYYAELGVKGFKVDFMDRDDQEMVAFNYRAAETCAKYKLLLDLHGMYKPSGLNRTYPNVLNFEGVHGLENMKWSPESVDQVKYDVTIPFIRQVAGPMDYTQGAMRNAVKGSYFPCNSEPMSQGTRCRQLALYVIFESPLNMLCDTPGNYEREVECTDFITGIPTVWDETHILDAKLGEYIVTARRKGDSWYIGGITDGVARNLEIDCSFLGDKDYVGDLFKDGMNAHRIGKDFKRESVRLNKRDKLKT